MAKQTRARKPTNEVHLPGSMTLAEVRKLLNGIEGKEIRGHRADCVWLAAHPENMTWARPFSLAVLLEPPAFRCGADQMEKLLSFVFNAKAIECLCSDEEHLRRVMLDPSQGEWCFEDEVPPHYYK